MSLPAFGWLVPKWLWGAIAVVASLCNERNCEQETSTKSTDNCLRKLAF